MRAGHMQIAVKIGVKAGTVLNSFIATAALRRMVVRSTLVVIKAPDLIGGSNVLERGRILLGPRLIVPIIKFNGRSWLIIDCRIKVRIFLLALPPIERDVLSVPVVPTERPTKLKCQITRDRNIYLTVGCHRIVISISQSNFATEPV